MQLINKAVNQIVNRFTKERTRQLPAELFATVISVPPCQEHKVRGAIENLSWPNKLIVTTSQEDRYSAMASSDLGVAVNGQAVLECATMQLPTAILDYSSYVNHYFSQLYNSFKSELNIAANGEGYPELLGQSFPEKIAEHWE